jgi:ABC-type multidrug transport system fused ATPase/permease subunit
MSFTTKYINFLTKLLNYKTKLYDVDFNQNWGRLFLKRKFSFFLAISNEIIGSAYNNYLPILFATIIVQKNYSLMPWIVLGYIVLEFFNRFAVNHFLYTKLVLEQSVRNSAYRFFLTTDPIHHATKSSGKIITLIETGCSDLYQYYNIFTSYILPDLVAYITVCVVLFTYETTLGLISLGFLAITIFVNYIYSVYHNKNLHPIVAGHIEDSRSIATENLTQNAIIRSSFASIEQIEYSQRSFSREVDIKSVIWFSSQLRNTALRTMFIIAAFIIISRIFWLLEMNLLPIESAIAVIGVYLASSYKSLGIGDNIWLLSEKATSVNRLYNFIREFGQASYSVLDEKKNSN